EAGVDVPQPIEHVVDARASGPDPTIGILARIEADVGVLPHPSAAHVGVGFDHSGKDHGIGIAVVDAGGTVGLEFVDGTDGSNPCSGNHDRFRGGSSGVESPDCLGRVDDLFVRVHL